MKSLIFSNILFLSIFSVFADTTDVKTLSIVEITKKGDHCSDDPNCFNRYHPAIDPVERAKPGEFIKFHTEMRSTLT